MDDLGNPQDAASILRIVKEIKHFQMATATAIEQLATAVETTNEMIYRLTGAVRDAEGAAKPQE